MESLRARTALVTGAAKRVGRAISLTLASQGINLVFSYRDSLAEALTTRSELQMLGVKALAVQADLTDLQSCDSLMHVAREHFGAVDILVNNASEFLRTPLEDISQDRDRFHQTLERMVGIHMRAPFYLASRLGIEMKARGWGRIINITDRVTAKGQAYRDYGIYLLTKYGLYGVTQVLAEELAPEVTVNSIAPGLVEPPPEFGSERVSQLVERIPLKRRADPEEIASDVLHLVKSESKTGSIILTDGGSGSHAF